MSDIKIEDNFLGWSEFSKLQSLMMSTPDVEQNGKIFHFPWTYNEKIDFADDKDKFQFVHVFYHEHAPASPVVEVINPIMEKLNVVAMVRIKANLLTRTPEIVVNKYHHDVSDYDDQDGKTIQPEKLKQITTSIYYVNTNNGYTEFEDGTKVENVANRFITFPCNLNHRGTSCTDKKIKIVINFNYFSNGVSS
tara:strand:+ start:27 stop:605 length:579 start_codon:yes stop_codon:yes gene_type:complete